MAKGCDVCESVGERSILEVHPSSPNSTPNMKRRVEGKNVALIFEWHNRKAAENLKRHGVSFQEAITVFADSLSVTTPELLHAAEEERWLITGYSDEQRLLVVVYTERDEALRIISARKATAHERRNYETGETMMKEATPERQDPDMPDEYDFTNGIRGKYADRFDDFTILVKLDNDVARMFPNAKAVNEALRALGKIIAQHQPKAD